MSMDVDFKKLVDEQLNKKGLSRKDLCEKIKCEASYLSNVLNLNKTPSDNYLAKIAPFLEMDLKFLLLYYSYKRAENNAADNKGDKNALENIRNAWSDILALYKPPVSTKKTLDNFPEAFCPLVVVVGDKREKGERIASPGDILAYSASTADLKSIHLLGLPKDTEIISDKVFMMKDKEEIKEILDGRNILCIGSPAANLVSREVNKRAIFRFDIELAALQHSELYQADLFVIKNDIAKLREYPKKRGVHFINNITAQFHHGGLFNPMFEGPAAKRAFFLHPGKGFAVISLAENPYDEDTYAILVGGIHLSSTIGAIQFLSDKDNFTNHPVGGIVELLEISTDFYERIKTPKVRWEEGKTHDGSTTTGSYNLETLIDRLEYWNKRMKEDAIAHAMCSWERPEAYGGRKSINQAEIIKDARLELCYDHDKEAETSFFTLVNEIPGCIRLLEKINNGIGEF